MPAVAGAGAVLGVLAAAVAVAAFSPRAATVLAAGGVLIVAGLLTRRDAVTVLCAFVVLLFGISARYVVGPIGALGTPANLIGLGALAWWVLTRLMVPIPGEGRQPIRSAVILFGWCMGAAYGVAWMRALSPLESGGADRTMIGLAAMSGIALLAADGIGTRALLDRLLRTIVLACSFFAGLGLVQFVLGIDLASKFTLPFLELTQALDGIAQRSDFRRVQATATHPIEFGVVLAMVLPLALHFAFASERTTQRWRPWLPVVLLGMAIPMSLSRAATLGLVVGLLLLVPAWSWRRRLQMGAGFVVAALVMQMVFPGLLGTVRSLFSNFGTDPSIVGRTEDYDYVSLFIARSPAFGRGLGTFNPLQYDFLDNQYLGTLVETGFVGLAALLALFLTGIGVAVLARRRSTDLTTRTLGQTLVACIAVAVATYATFDGLSFAICTGLLFLLIGCAGALWRLERPAVTDQTGGARRRPT